MYLKKWMIAAALLAGTGSYAQTVKLSLAKGQRYEATTVVKANSTVSVMGQEMENIMSSSTVEAIEVKDVRAKDIDLVITPTKIKTSIQAMGQDMSYDSEKKDNSGQLADELDKRVNKSKMKTIDMWGKIIKQDKEEEDMNPMMGNSMGSGVPIFIAGLIGKEIKAGASWPDSVNTSTEKVKTTVVGTYTVMNVEGNIATINFTGTQSVAGVMDQGGQEMNMTSAGKVNTTAKVDISTGTLVESSSTSDNTISIEAMGMSIPATAKTTSTVTVKKL